MSQLIPFQFETHNISVHIDDHGNPWWEAQDVCAVLGIADVSKAIARLKMGEKRTSESRNVLILNEKGLYRLIMRSNKPEAERFQDWVFGDVLPQIRKTGRYASNPAALVKDPAIKMLIEMAVQLDATRAIATEAREEAIQAKAQVEVITNRYRMTIEQFVGMQGLLHQIPPSSWQAMARWLTHYCATLNWDAPKIPVEGRPWKEEGGYPIEALMRYVEYLRKKPQQIRLVKEEG